MDLPSDAGASLQHIPLGRGVPCPLGLPMGYVYLVYFSVVDSISISACPLP